MMHASRALSSAQATHYFETEYRGGDYYTRGKDELPGYWQGRAAAELGLRGRVRAEEFASLLQGVHPRTGEILVPAREGLKTRRAGWDFQISADKSVSLAALVGGDKRIVEAHDAAVRVAVEAVEHYAQSRIKGGRDTETTGRIVAGIFQHESSRNLDPQLHSHVVVMNVTRRGDGEWRALQEQGMFRVQRLGTAVYNSEMAVSLERLGYRLDITKKGEVKIAGLTEKQREAFSTRRAEILKWCATNRTAPCRKGQEAAHATRSAKKRGIDRVAVLGAWRDRARDLGIDFRGMRQGVRERAGRAARAVGLSQRPDDRTVAVMAVDRALGHFSERRSVLRLDQVEQSALQWGLGDGVRLEHVREALEKRRDLHFSKDGLRLTTDQTWSDEIAVQRLEFKGRKDGTPIRAYGHPIETTGLSAEQRAAVEMILKTRSQVVGVEGKAGTGKSYALRAVSEEALKAGWAVRGFAPTGRAAELLGAAGIPSKTVESLLREPKGLSMGRPELWIVDEAGLLDTRRAKALLEKATTEHAKVVLVGDRAQHRAVEAGVPYAQLVDAGMLTAKLTEIQRQRDRALREVVENLSEKRVGYAVRVLERESRIREYAHRNFRHAAAAKDYASKPEGTLVIAPSNAEVQDLNKRIREELKASGKIGGREVQAEISLSRGLTAAQRRDTRSYEAGDVLTFHRSSRSYGIEAGKKGRVVRVDEKRLTLDIDGRKVALNPGRFRGFDVARVEARAFAAGDRVAFRENLRAEGVRNGTIGMVERVDVGRRTLDVRLDDQRRVSIDLSSPRGMDHGYAVTSHKSQGQTMDRVIAVVDTQHGPVLVNQEQAYVSLSRARDNVTVYTDDQSRLVKAWGRDSSGDQRAMDLDRIRPEAREWQREAAAGERRAQALLDTRPWDQVRPRNDIHEYQQRQRTDIDPEQHHAQVRALEEARRAEYAAPYGRASLRDRVDLERNRLYEMRHGTERSNLGPQPRLEEREELQLHQAQRLLGKSSPLTRDALERLGKDDLRKVAGAMREHGLGRAHLGPGDPVLRQELDKVIRAVREVIRPTRGLEIER